MNNSNYYKDMLHPGVENILANENALELMEARGITMINDCDFDDGLEEDDEKKKQYTYIN